MPYCPIHQTYQFCDCHKQRKTEPERTSEPALSLFDRMPTKAPPSNGTATSDAAAASLSPETLRDQHRAILNALWTYGPLMDEEIQQAADLSPNAERPRRGELVAAGLVIDSEATGVTRSGRKAVRWDLSAKARDLASRALQHRKSA